MKNTLLTVDEVCDELMVPRSTWARWRALGVGPSVIILPNRKIRIRRSELDSWLRSREVA
jgi:excisionase family DNA binding protein